MARKPNYDFEKRKKEQERKAKKDAKREDRLRRRREGATEESADEHAEPGLRSEDEGTAPPEG